MNTSSLIKQPAVTAATCFIALSLISFGFILKPQHTRQSGHKNYLVHKILSAKEIKQILISTKSNNLWLDIYYVKQTPDIKKKDFNLTIVPRNNEGKPVTQINKATLQKGLANYAKFMHNKKIPASDLLLGYQVTINKNKLKEQNQLHIIVDAMQPAEPKLYMSGSSQVNALSYESKPIGKCPPGCIHDETITAVMENEYPAAPVKP